MNSRVGIALIFLCAGVLLGFGAARWFERPPGQVSLGHEHGPTQRSAQGLPTGQPGAGDTRDHRQTQTNPTDALSDNGSRAGMDPLAEQYNDLLAQKHWLALEQWLLQHAVWVGQSEEDPGASLFRVLQADAGVAPNGYTMIAQRKVLEAYLAAQPQDERGLFALSQLQQRSGLREAALETLLQILDLNAGVEVNTRARADADTIITQLDSELETRGVNADRISFWRYLIRRYPVSDYFRFQLATLLADSRQWSQAQKVIAETGHVDVAPAAVEALRTRIERGERGLNFIRRGDQLLATVISDRGLQLTLLVDTGATITSLSKRTLREIAATRLATRVQLQTASGIVSTGLYEVSGLQVEGFTLEKMRVVELPVDIEGIDGLLGIDALEQLGWSVDNL